MGDLASKSHQGRFADGATFRIEVPARWNDRLLLYSPGGTADPASSPPLAGNLGLHAWALDQGYAVAATSYASTAFWAVEDAFRDQVWVLDEFERLVGRPEHTIAWGYSIGGPITAGLVQSFPDRFAGALPMCGSLAGGIATRNVNLDSAFVFTTLLGAGAPIELVRIGAPEANWAAALEVLRAAQQSPAGRARIALAGAMSNLPGWFDPDSPQPAPDDHAARQFGRFRWFEDILFEIYFFSRAQLEGRAGGNPSFNTGVDYAAQLAGSTDRDQVGALYADAGLDLDADLETLANATRIQADPVALEYLARHVTFDGRLHDVPVLALHTTDDGLVIVEHEQAYRDVVEWAGSGDLLRQAYVRRPGHCTFTDAETIAALEVLVDRIERGTWRNDSADALNEAAARLGRETPLLGTGAPVPSAFVEHSPPAYPRPYDVRDAARSPAGPNGRRSALDGSREREIPFLASGAHLP